MKTYTELVQQQKRMSGVILHPTSLPSGKLDSDAFRWLDFMAEAGLTVWQVLPLGVPQQNLSPYQCYSAFAINPDLLSTREYANPELQQSEFIEWCNQEDHWLHDYALFKVLKQHYDQKAWYDWPEEYKFRHAEALNAFNETHQEQVLSIYWQQYCLYRRWNEIRAYAHDLNILLFGDMPIFVAHDSADVWVHPKSFQLDETGHPLVVAGVPPDYFSKTGQRWGNPHYNWEYMLENDFSWWLSRLKNHLTLFDLVRIDHFRGLEAAWIIPAECETAVEGEWQKIPGEKLLQHLQQDLGQIPIVAEDLGIITPEVNALREKFNLPGMSVIQFSFDESEDNPHKPKNITYDRIVYTGTHDNDTTVGWFESLEKQTQAYILKTLEIDELALTHSTSKEVVSSIINTALKSQGQLAIFPLQDLLMLDSDSRMNIPGISENNWTWQFQWDQIPDGLATETHERLKHFGRLLEMEQA